MICPRPVAYHYLLCFCGCFGQRLSGAGAALCGKESTLHGAGWAFAQTGQLVLQPGNDCLYLNVVVHCSNGLLYCIRLEFEMSATGALHIIQPPPQQQQQQPPTSNNGCCLPADLLHSATSGSSTSNSHQNYPGLEGFTPQWLLLESNEWRKRVQVTQRFVNAVRVMMYRNRAQTRLQKLKAIAGEEVSYRW